MTAALPDPRGVGDDVALCFTADRGWHFAASPDLHAHIERLGSSIVSDTLIHDFLRKGKTVQWIADATGATRRQIADVAKTNGLTISNETDRVPHSATVTTIGAPAQSEVAAVVDDITPRLDSAAKHPAGAVRRQAQRVRDALTRLDELIDDDEQHNAAKRAAAAAKEAARAEVHQLEEKLRQARAKLRGTPAPANGGGVYACAA